MENPALTAYRKGNGRITHRRLVQVERLCVPPEDMVLKREPVRPDPKIKGVAVPAEDPRMADVSLQSLRDDHGRALHLEAVIEDLGKPFCVWTAEIVEPTPVIFPFK